VREAWKRTTPALEPDQAFIERLMRQALPGATISAVEATSGGLANTNLKVSLTTETGYRVVLLRYWQRDPEQASKELAILQLIGSRVPTPQIFAFGQADPDFGLPYVILEWIEGRRLELIASQLTGPSLYELGSSIGSALAAIHSFTFDHPGFFDANLVIPTAIDFGQDGLLRWLRKCLLEGLGGERLGAKLTADLLTFVENKGYVLNSAWATQACLTHGDFNGSNILVRLHEQHSSWSAAAILDWEFAFAGGPAFDLGNLLRPPLGLLPSFVDGVVHGYRTAGGSLPQGWHTASRLADLTSWADFLNTPGADAALIEDAKNMIRRTIDLEN
jgi:aminoglycoside phosphotransferase (APT) family kinase protein